MEYTVKEIICSDGGKATVYIPIRTEEEEKKQQECIAKAGASLLRAAIAAEMKQVKMEQAEQGLPGNDVTRKNKGKSR